jgi:hypothetical protein
MGTNFLADDHRDGGLIVIWMHLFTDQTGCPCCGDGRADVKASELSNAVAKSIILFLAVIGLVDIYTTWHDK